MQADLFDDFDPWTQLADRQISRGRKRELAKIDKRMERERAKKEEREQRRQWNMYRRNFVERKRALLQGEYRTQLASLIKFIRRLKPEDAVPLIEMIKQATWLKQAEEATRLMVLSLIDSAIIRHRVRLGMSPIDDALPGETPNVFLIVRRELLGV